MGEIEEIMVWLTRNNYKYQVINREEITVFVKVDDYSMTIITTIGEVKNLKGFKELFKRKLTKSIKSVMQAKRDLFIVETKFLKKMLKQTREIK